MKILFLTYDLPYPLDSGGKIRSYHLLKGLARKHEITLFSFYRRREQLRYLRKIREICRKIRAFKRRRLFSPINLPFLPFLPFPAALYYSPRIEREIHVELAKEHYDLIHFESFYTSMYLNKKLNTTQILGTENIEWKVYLGYASQQKLPLLREAIRLEALRMRRFEEKSWKKADICLAVSKENMEEIKRSGGKKCYLVPNGVDLEYFKFSQKTRKLANQKIVLFVGNFKYIQNQDAALFLVKEIFPLVKKEIKNIQLLIVGRNPTEQIKNLANKDVLIKSEIEDIRRVYKRVDILIAPLRVGSGTKFKILEAMAVGVPVVTTRIGGEGIEAFDGKEILIREEPSKLAQATIGLLENEELRQRIIINARRLVEEKYSWEGIGKKLEKIYQAIVS